REDPASTVRRHAAGSLASSRPFGDGGPNAHAPSRGQSTMLNHSRKLGLLIPSLALAIACGGGSTTRMVDDPTGQATTYGGPKNTSYHAEVDTSQGAAQVTVFQSSLCDVIPITVMQRYEEVLHGDKVVQRNPVTKKQVAGDPTGTVPCDQ